VEVAKADLERHSTPGPHKVTFRFEEAGNLVSYWDLDYGVNSRPSIEVTSDRPIEFKRRPTGPVTLLLLVSDVDGDAVLLRYRFDGEG
jgi:hypothetical protein